MSHAVIVGADSQIGSWLAYELAQRGYSLTLIGYDIELLTLLNEQLSSHLETECTIHRIDLSRDSSSLQVNTIIVSMQPHATLIVTLPLLVGSVMLADKSTSTVTLQMLYDKNIANLLHYLGDGLKDKIATIINVTTMSSLKGYILGVKGSDSEIAHVSSSLHDYHKEFSLKIAHAGLGAVASWVYMLPANRREMYIAAQLAPSPSKIAQIIARSADSHHKEIRLSFVSDVLSAVLVEPVRQAIRLYRRLLG